MIILAAVRTSMRAVQLIERPVAWLDGLLSIMAGEVRGVRRGKVKLELYVSVEEFDRIAANADIRSAMERAMVMK